MEEITDTLKLKNGRELKVTFEFAQGLSKEESQRRIEEMYDVILNSDKKKNGKSKDCSTRL